MKEETKALTIKNELPETLIVLSAEHQVKVAELVEKSGIEVKRETFQEADFIYSDIHKLSKQIEQARKKAKAPILDLGKQLDAAAKTGLKPLEEAKEDLGSRIKAHEKEEEKLAEEQRKRAEELKMAESGRAQLTDFPDEPEQIIERPVKSSSVRTTKTQKVIIDDPTKIPYSIGNVVLLIPDTTAIKKLLKAGMDVPGCRLDTEEGTGATGA